MTQQWLFVPALVLALASLAAGPPPKEDRVVQELRGVRDAMVEAFENGDVDGLLKYVHPNVVATWPNGETVRGHAGIRNSYERMRVGDDREVRHMTSKLTVDELSPLHNDKYAVAFGSMANHFDLDDGKGFNLQSRWTATLVKDLGQWKVVAFHISTNAYDNGIMALILRTALMRTAIGAGLVGLLLGIAAGVKFARRKPAVV